jgi:PEP-CTERM motif-containing protein
MKKILLLAVLALALPTALLAGSSVDYTNSGGMLSGSSSGLTLTGSALIVANGLNGGGPVFGNLGTVTFQTGALMSGSLAQGGTFAGGGWFTITGNGTNGIPNGTVFSGTFDGPVTWTLVTLSNGTHNYTLGPSGFTGMSGSGVRTVGATNQLTINTGKGFFDGSTTIASGDSNLSLVVPEPGSLGLLGTGLIGLGGVVRRKLKA